MRTSALLLRLIWAPLALLLLALPLAPADLWGSSHAGYDAARVLQGLVFLAVSAPLIGSGKSSLPLLGLLVLAMLSSMLALHPAIAARETLWLAAWLLSIAVLARALIDTSAKQALISLIVACQFCYVLLASSMLLYGLLVEQFVVPWHAFPGYENPRYFNHTQTLSIPLLAALSLWTPLARSLRRLAAAAVALHVFLICVFLARATVVALVLAALLVCLWLRQTRLLGALLKWALVGVLIYAVSFHLLPHLLGMPEAPAFRDAGERGSIEARFYLWKIAAQAIREHPWLGLGPMHFAHTLNGEAAHPHNIYLQIAAEYGLPFACLAAWLLLGWLRQRLTLLRQDLQAGAADQTLAIGCMVAVVAALIDGLFSGNFVMPMSQTWFMFCAALLLALQSPSPGPHAVAPATSTASRLFMRALALCMTAGLVLVLASMAQELAQPIVNLVHGPSLSGDNRNPRFWLDGWF